MVERKFASTDSIGRRININKELIEGYVYRKKYPGQTLKEIAHNCQYTLENDKPDTRIINVGTNIINKDSPSETVVDIMEIVDICHKHGVKDVYISAITHRPRFEDEIINTNWMVKAPDIYRGFIFIENYNITKGHIWKDRVHLNDQGTTILMNRDLFISAINGNRTA